jgi:hypothetical protein
VIVASTIVHVAAAALSIRAAVRSPGIPPEPKPEEPGTWLTHIAHQLPEPLAACWFGIALAAPLAAMSRIAATCFLVLVAVLSSDKIARATRFVLAPALALAFGLIVRSFGPWLYHALFPALPPHQDWFEAVSWAGILLVAVPLPWRLPSSQRWLAASALVVVAVPIHASTSGITGLILGTVLARAAIWRPDDAAKPRTAAVRLP